MRTMVGGEVKLAGSERLGVAAVVGGAQGAGDGEGGAGLERAVPAGEERRKSRN